MTMQRVGTGLKAKTIIRLMRLCSFRDIALRSIRQGRGASALWQRPWWLDHWNPPFGCGLCSPQPPSFQMNAKELPGSKVSACGASRKSARVEPPRVLSPPIDQPPYFQHACGHIPETSISNTPFRPRQPLFLPLFTNFVTICRLFPASVSHRKSQPIAALDRAVCRPNKPIIPSQVDASFTPLATAMPPKAAKKPAPAGRRRSSAGVAKRSGGGVQRMFALFAPLSLARSS
jgi:hypothetical protein